MISFSQIAGLLSAAAAASAGELASFPTDSSGYSSTPGPSPQSMGMSNVLRVVVDNMLYPVSIDALHIVSRVFNTCSNTCSNLRSYIFLFFGFYYQVSETGINYQKVVCI